MEVLYHDSKIPYHKYQDIAIMEILKNIPYKCHFLGYVYALSASIHVKV